MSLDGQILPLLWQSALRALLLGACVFVALKLARLRDPGAETAIWTMVLIAALAMPLLDAWLPGGVTVPLPRWPAPHAAAFVGAPAPHAVAASPGWIAAHGGQLLWGLYCLVATAGLARLAIGLALVVRLYRAAEPVADAWACNRNIRASADVAGPLSFADRILLPADYYTWPRAKLLAVLAHEEAHIRRGDFFIQLLASAYRALFWFSPFAWWLQLKLGELAETASDKAAIRQINDPVRYAEILIEVSRRARRMPTAAAMARGPGVAKRVNHILAGAPDIALGKASRALALAGVLVISIAFAQVRAAVATAPAVSQPAPVTAKRHGSALAVSGARRAVVARTPAARAKPAVQIAQAAPPAEPRADFTYNPRALLDDPETAVLTVILSTQARAGGSPGAIVTSGSGY